ncbi:SigE family RNA polymerase sigma factor [Jiangella mangrovi]|uniref:RNA polymerase sigma-70 factor (Sigma-E family) n=1 Tax=Jiangella mangrovi TaxID=1524084 RepID=A0A7W9LPY9_9ACTN|nr:RNA polymerase sigma-70 factor (sigma-E family) [Jiangella mangrovi]
METFEEWAGSRLVRLKRIAVLLAGNHADADDLLQETLTKAYVGWRKVSRADDPDAYVRAMLVNTHISAARSRARRTQRDRLAASPEGIDTVPDVVDRSALSAALAELGARQRAVVVLRYYCDLPDPQIAALLGCSEGTVRSQAARALAHLRAGAVEGELR